MISTDYILSGDGHEDVPKDIRKFVQQREYLITFTVLDLLLGVGGACLNGRRVNVLLLFLF